MEKEMKQSANAEFQDIENQNPDNSGQSDEENNHQITEDDYKNLQSFATKSRQELINTAKRLVEKDPKEVENLEPSIQKKVIKEIWGYDNIDELKIMLPDVFDNRKQSDVDFEYQDDDVIEKLKREQELLKLKLTKKEIEDELEKIKIEKKEIINSIPNFEEKVKEELKYISSELPVKERIKRATKLVIGGQDISLQAYLELQGKTNIKTSKGNIDEDFITKKQEELRKYLGLSK